MLIELKNTTSRISGITPEIRKEVSDILSYSVENAAFVMKARGIPPGTWDGRKKLLQRDNSFPAGLTYLVLEWAKENDIELEFKDYRIKPSDPPLDLKLQTDKSMRPYQTDALEISRVRPRGVFVLGTGAGKTFTSAAIIADKGLPTLFITPDVGLREQTYNVYAGLFGEGKISKQILSPAPIVITNIHQIAKHSEEDLRRFKVLIIDEMHHSSSNSYLDLNLKMPDCYYRYGLTGTYVRGDGTEMVMHGVLSSVLLTRTTSQVIQDGFLVPADILITEHQLSKKSKLNYRDAYNFMTVDPEFNCKVASIIRDEVSRGNQTLVLVRRVEHGLYLESIVHCDDVIFLSGRDSYEHREIVKKRFSEKKIRCIIATDIFGEGQDIPSIDSLVNVRLQESEIQTKQGVGRALRLAEGAKSYGESVTLGKSRARIFDFKILGNKHLLRHSIARIEHYKSEEAFSFI